MVANLNTFHARSTSKWKVLLAPHRGILNIWKESVSHDGHEISTSFKRSNLFVDSWWFILFHVVTSQDIVSRKHDPFWKMKTLWFLEVWNTLVSCGSYWWFFHGKSLYSVCRSLSVITLLMGCSNHQPQPPIRKGQIGALETPLAVSPVTGTFALLVKQPTKLPTMSTQTSEVT